MDKLTKSLVCAMVAILATGCSENSSDKVNGNQPSTADQVTEKPSEPVDITDADIVSAVDTLDEAGLAQHIEVLASNEFGGRAPFTTGEEKTLAYLENEFKKLGVEPANGDSYRQLVDLVELTSDPNMQLKVSAGDSLWELAYQDQMMAWTKRVVDEVSMQDSELVFVGYGIVAPEYNWNDYDGLDMTGKTAVILVNDPGYATQDENVFSGNAMTYYGRWTYKYEEAARQGADGAIIIHETGAAGYPWEVVSGSWAGAQFDLAAQNDNMHRVKVEGWVTQEVAKELFTETGHDFDALTSRAAKPEFEAVPLGASASITVKNGIRRSQSANIVAKITGSERPDEVFAYMGHWDHLGIRFGEGDHIFNGAVDNATGTAALLEMAKAFKSLPRPPKRTILFLAVTAEESGLLGSAHYAANPLFPLNQTVGGVNIDAMNVIGPMNDIVVVGYGNSELEDILARHAGMQSRTLTQEPTPEKGYFFRSDHFNFAKKGVPVLYAEGGTSHKEKGEDYVTEAAADYTANRYHKPGDEYDPNWDLRGAVADMALYFTIGLEVAESDTWPNWYEGTAFRGIRDASMAAK